MVRSLKFVDIFSGLGGFHVGLRRLGHKCVLSCENNAALRSLYEHNFSITPHPDIRTLRADMVPAHDIMCAGFPCQPFSKAGEQLGLACERDGDLFHHLLRILKYRRPKYSILENVAHLERHGGGATYRKMRKQLENLGYAVDQRILSPHEFGIPQVRERLFIVCSLRGLKHFTWPTSTGKTPSIFDILDDNPPRARPLSNSNKKCLALWQKFLDLYPRDRQLPSFPIWAMEFGANYPYDETTPTRLTSRELSKYRGSYGVRLGSLPPSERMKCLPAYAQQRVFPKWKQTFIRQNRELYVREQKWIDKWLPKLMHFPASLQKFEWNCKGERRQLSEHILQFRASGVRVKRANAAPALIAMTTTQVPIIARHERYMTVRECGRLQGLGDLEYMLAAPTLAYRALGNAVNADIVTMIADALLSKHRGYHKCKQRLRR